MVEVYITIIIFVSAYCHRLTGEVRRIEIENINKRLEQGDICMLTSLGYSPSGEVFNVPSESLAADCAGIYYKVFIFISN